MYFFSDGILVEQCLGVQTITRSLLAESLYLAKGLFCFASSCLLLMQHSGEKCRHQGQWNTSCLEILCMFCSKTVSVSCFQLLNFQHFAVASDHFRLLFIRTWMENGRKVLCDAAWSRLSCSLCKWSTHNSFPTCVMRVGVFSKARTHQQSTFRELIGFTWAISVLWGNSETFLCCLEVREKTYSW